MLIDQNAEVVWAHHYNKGIVEFIDSFPNGDILLGVDVTVGGPALPPESIGAGLVRMTADGNVIWARSYFRPRGRMLAGAALADGTVIATGLIPTPGGLEDAGQLFALHVDGNGEVLWCRGFQPNGWYGERIVNLIKTAEDQFVIGASQQDVTIGSMLSLIKFNLGGDTLWTRNIGSLGRYYEMHDLEKAPDGGLVMSGICWQVGGFVIKADSMGRVFCAEHERSLPPTLVELFPVDSSFTLTYTTNVVRHTFNAAVAPNGSLELIEGCTVTGMPSIEELIGRMRIKPNPTPGRITVELPTPLLPESFYSVFDATGRLLYERPLPPGATTADIDLSRFGTGTYLLRITDPEGQRNERVVVE
jgi:hypothetical protein